MPTIVEVKDLKAYYHTHAYGVQHTVKAVDGITLNIPEGSGVRHHRRIWLRQVHAAQGAFGPISRRSTSSTVR